MVDTATAMLDSLAELPTIIRGKALYAGYEVFCTLLDRGLNGDTSALIEEVENRIRQWPSSIRTVAATWRELGDVVRRPSWPLVRTLVLHGSPSNNIDCLAGLKASHFINIRALRLVPIGHDEYHEGPVGVNCPFELLDQLLQRFDGTFLEELTLQLDPCPASFAYIQHLANAGCFRSLRRIELIFVPCQIVSILQETLFCKLSELKMRVFPPIAREMDGESSACESLSVLDPRFENAGTVAERLLALDWSGNSYPDEAIGNLLLSPFLHSIASLDVGGNFCGQHTLHAIGHALYRQSLQKISFRESPIGAAGWKVFATNMFPRLIDLNLALTDYNDTTQQQDADDAIACLCDSDTLPRLECLTVDATHIGPIGARAFAGGKMASRLTYLSIHDLTSDASSELFNDPEVFPKLIDLELISCALDDVAFGKLRQMRFLPRLRRLMLLGTKFTSSDATALFGETEFNDLYELDIGFQLTEEVALAMFRVLKADKLRVVLLRNNGLTVEGLKAFARWSVSRQLWIADLALNLFGDEGIEALCESEGSWQLNQLNTSGSRCSQGIERKMIGAKQFPWLKWINGLAVNPQDASS